MNKGVGGHDLRKSLKMLSADEREEAEERRLAEVEFIRSAYSSSEAYVVDGAGGLCSIVRVLRLQVDALHACPDGQRVEVNLALEMPEAYPLREDAVLNVRGSVISCPSNPPFVRKAALNAIPRLVETCQQAASEVAEAQGGGEAVWSVLSRAEEWVDSDWVMILKEHVAFEGTRTAQPEETVSETATLGRRIIYSHHIIANSKRRGLADLASQYRLGGYAKIGWPGVILVEGSESNCQLFVDEIKRWRWQQLQVRGEETKEIPEGESLDSHRQLPPKFAELGEDEMSLLASNCREAGLERLFLSCMKINDRRASDGDAVECDGPRRNDSEPPCYGVLVHVDHMNDGRRYRKWLRKTCQTQGCTLLIKQFRQNDSGRAKIYVGILGERESVRQVMKQWRSSRVDVDSKNKPCLERMMHVLEEGSVQRPPAASASLNDEHGVDCTFEELESLASDIDAEWARKLRNLHHGGDESR